VEVVAPGSGRYADPAAYLLISQAWKDLLLEFCHLVGDVAALAQADAELHTDLTDLERMLAGLA
jgi:hypothetical protein